MAKNPTTVVKMNQKESIRITKWGNGGVSCSLVEKEDEDDVPTISEEDTKPTTSSKSPKTKVEKVIDTNVENPFKDGDNVLYDGTAYTVARAYVYKGKPYCILDNKKQVSASRLSPNNKKRK